MLEKCRFVLFLLSLSAFAIIRPLVLSREPASANGGIPVDPVAVITMGASHPALLEQAFEDLRHDKRDWDLRGGLI